MAGCKCDFLCTLHCFAQLQHGFHKLPSYMFYSGNVVCVPVHFFLRFHSFSSWGPYCHYKIFILLLWRNWSPLFFISCSSSFSVIHVNVKINLKERIGFLVVVSSLKVWAAMRFITEKCRSLKCKISIRLTWRGGRTDVLRTDDFVRTKISWMQK